MESVLRAVCVYLFLFLLFRISGKRTLMESSPFALILIFLISSSVADALKGVDKSITNSLVLACTLILMHVLFARLKSKSARAAKLIEDVPTILVKDGKADEQKLLSSKVTRDDLLREARKQHILELDRIKYAIMESDGSISIIKKKEDES